MKIYLNDPLQKQRKEVIFFTKITTSQYYESLKSLLLKLPIYKRVETSVFSFFFHSATLHFKKRGKNQECGIY